MSDDYQRIDLITGTAVLMSDDYQRIDLITGTARRRCWTTEQKLQIIEASYEPGESVSSVARRQSKDGSRFSHRTTRRSAGAR